MKKMEISPRLYIDVMGYPRDIVIVNLGTKMKIGFPENIIGLSFGGGMDVSVS